MDILEIELERFKKIQKAKINLSPINVLIGGNNSGKSSVLQGIHFSIVAAVASLRAGKITFTQDELLFCPARNFVTLRNGAEYANQSNFGHLRMSARSEDNEELNYHIRVYRARNEGNVGCERSGSRALGTAIAESIPPFSIYVPGLAGIPQVEEFRSEAVIRKGVASGDANLYLRNVLHLLKLKGLKDELARLMKGIFPDFAISISYDPVYDSYLDIRVKHLQGQSFKPLEQTGTGILQALQIFSYATLFKPSLLLLDEPDAHLHPDNQVLLSQALLTIAADTNTKIIISTHSRHMVDALYGDANFIWLKDGKVYEQSESIERLPLLMDIGALDSFEKLREGNTGIVVLTEDRSVSMLKHLLEASGYDLDDVLIYSYKSSSNLVTAGLLTEFINEIAPETTVIVHTDNDFFTDDEIQNISSQIVDFGAYPFVTEGSDIESYFLDAQHLSGLLDVDANDIRVWLDEVAEALHNKLMHKFSRKRDDAKFKLYKGNTGDAPDTLALMGEEVPLAENKRLGKVMLSAVRGKMNDTWGAVVEPVQISDHIASPRLIQILAEIGD